MNNIGASMNLNTSAAAQNLKSIPPSQLMKRREELLETKETCGKSIERSTEYIKNTDAQIQELKPQIAREKARIRQHTLFSFGTMGAAIAATLINAAAGCSAMGPIIAMGCGIVISLTSLVKCDNHFSLKHSLESKVDEAANQKNVHTEFIAGWKKKIESADREIAGISKQIESLQSDPSRMLDDNVKEDRAGKKSDTVSTDDDMLVVDGVRLKKKKSLDFLSHLLHRRHEQA